jgi:hypothetical protein
MIKTLPTDRYRANGATIQRDADSVGDLRSASNGGGSVRGDAARSFPAFRDLDAFWSAVLPADAELRAAAEWWSE